MNPAAYYTCPYCGRQLPDYITRHVCNPPKKDLAFAAKIDPGVALAERLAADE